MRDVLRRTSALAAVVTVAALVVVVTAAGAGQSPALSGIAYPSPSDEGTSDCSSVPDGYAYLTLELTGDLVGCLYTSEDYTYEVIAGHIYKEWGSEIVDACVDLDHSKTCDSGEPAGTFETTYVFHSKWEGEPYASAQISGGCRHPIVPGSGTGDFSTLKGRLDFTDHIVDGVAVDFHYGLTVFRW